MSRAATNKLTAALRHDVNFVARMRHLEIRTARLGQLNYEGTMFKQRDVVFALGTGQATQRVRETNLQTFAVAHGDVRNNTLQCEPQPNSMERVDWSVAVLIAAFRGQADGRRKLLFSSRVPGHQPFRWKLMRSDDLRDLAGDPKLISGIYNYCDRWCERCQFTSRCFLYATEQADPDLADPEVRDINNEKFWGKLQDIFRSTAEMIAEWAAETGVDLNSIDVSEEMAERERAAEAAEQSELSHRAQKYITSVNDWFRDEFNSEENVHDDMQAGPRTDEEDITIQDAVAVIRWYQFFIAVKLMRALSGGVEEDDDDLNDDDLSMDFLTDFETAEEDVDYDEVMARSERMDANGSAKIALVAMDRSIAAWRSLQVSVPDQSESIKPMLIELSGLRLSVEARFPRARDFIRPGLDEALTDFVS